jgi:hypothetical protein
MTLNSKADTAGTPLEVMSNISTQLQYEKRKADLTLPPALVIDGARDVAEFGDMTLPRAILSARTFVESIIDPAAPAVSHCHATALCHKDINADLTKNFDLRGIAGTSTNGCGVQLTQYRPLCRIRFALRCENEIQIRRSPGFAAGFESSETSAPGLTAEPGGLNHET